MLNVVAVVPTPPAAEAAAGAWRARLGAGARLFVTVLAGQEAVERAGYTVHPVDLDPSRPPRLLRRALGASRRWPGLAGALWSLAASRAMEDVVLEMRAGDPDVVDLRRAPARAALAGEVGRALPHAMIVTAGEPAALPPRPWRRYDPDAQVSIVLPVYNGARYLSEALDSCLGQTHARLEVVVVDDASRDETPAIVEAYARRDRRVVAVRNERNLRLPGALNVGFARASGRLLTWTSHDNYYAPDAIETLVRYLCTWPDVDFVYSAFRPVDENGQVAPQPTFLSAPWRLRHWNVVGPYFLYRRAVWEAVGEFRTDMEFLEDYEYWVRVAKHFRLARLHLPRYFYRSHPDSMSRRASDVEGLRRRLRADHFAGDGAGVGRR